jgi:hypothetical protein
VLRYRQDVPFGTDLQEIARHVAEHLAGMTDPDDKVDIHVAQDVHIEIREHPDGDCLMVIGELDGAVRAPYLEDDFDPAADHSGIAFTPYQEPALGHLASAAAWARWLTYGHHERPES